MVFWQVPSAQTAAGEAAGTGAAAADDCDAGEEGEEVHGWEILAGHCDTSEAAAVASLLQTQSPGSFAAAGESFASSVAAAAAARHQTSHASPWPSHARPLLIRLH